MFDSINPVKGIVAYALGLALAASLAYNAIQAFELVSRGKDIAELQTQLAQADRDAQRIAKETAEENGKTIRRIADLGTELQASKDQQEKTNAQNQKLSAAAADALRLRTRAGGGPGLRDPYAKGPGPDRAQGNPSANPGNAAGGATDQPQAGGLVSEPLERLLFEIAAGADEVNVAYAACKSALQQTITLLNSPGR